MASAEGNTLLSPETFSSNHIGRTILCLALFRPGYRPEPEKQSVSRPVVGSVRVRLHTLTFHGYARLRTLTPQHSARLYMLGLRDTEVDSHALLLYGNKVGVGGIFV